MAEPVVNDLVNNDKMSLKDVYTLYENGKGRRYNLLFSVNGAALAILSFFAKDAKNGVLTGLTAFGIAALMIVFTWIMKTDIHGFGTNMARLGGPLGLFGPIGSVS